MDTTVKYLAKNQLVKSMTEYASFRQRLDAVLRTLEVQQVTDFLIAEKQWQPGQPANPEFAMWMMIAGSPTLKDLHAQARTWLIDHGHTEDAQAFLTKDRQSSSSTHKKRRHGK